MQALYYLFSGDAGADYTTLRSLLKDMGILPYPDTKYTKDGNLIRVKENIALKYPVFLLHVEMSHDLGYDHNTYNIPCIIHSIHDSRTIKDISIKADLHHNLRNSKFIQKTYPLEEFTYKSGIYILRPSHILAFAGKDIMVVSSQEEFTAAKQFYESKIAEYSGFNKVHMRDYRVIVSEYITDPMLFEGRKFHVRMYIGTTADYNGLINCTMAQQNGEILTAALPYVKSDWTNKEIHDTHGGSTPADYTFPKDFPGNMENIWPQLSQMVDELKKLCLDHRPFSQAKYSMQIFGLDVMITAAGEVKLIEVNSGPGLGSEKFRETEEGKAYYKNLNMWIWDNGYKQLIEKETK